MFPFPTIYKALQKALEDEEEKKPSGFTCPRCKKDHEKLLWRESGWTCVTCEDKEKLL